jgi:hypothetical protein
LVSFSVAAAPGDPPKGFRTVKWGAAPTAGLKKFAGPTDDGTSLYILAKGKKSQPLFDIPVAEEDYSYTKGKFYAGNAYLDSQPNLERMKAALSKAYGPPTFVNEKLNIWAWEWPRSKIKVSLSYQAKFARTTVTFLNNSI